MRFRVGDRVQLVKLVPMLQNGWQGTVIDVFVNQSVGRAPVEIIEVEFDHDFTRYMVHESYLTIVLQTATEAPPAAISPRLRYHSTEGHLTLWELSELQERAKEK